MNHAKRALVSSKNFVVAHKLPIAIAATAVTTTVVVRRVIGSRMEAAEQFIEEKGLTVEFLKTFLDENI